MSTDRQFTEDIEIDDEPVEPNIAHSLFFDTYYQSLTDIELSNRQLLDAQEQLRWYTSQLDEVDRLADEARIPNSSTISAAALPQVHELDRIIYEKDFKLFNINIELLKKNIEDRKIEVNSVELSNKNYIQNIHSQLAIVSGEIKQIEIEIERHKIEANRIKQYEKISAIPVLIFLFGFMIISFPHSIATSIITLLVISLILAILFFS